jgi:hypothetical protein
MCYSIYVILSVAKKWTLYSTNAHGQNYEYQSVLQYFYDNNFMYQAVFHNWLFYNKNDLK